MPPAPRRINPPPTREKLDYADMAVIDLSKAQDAKGRADLAIQVSEAMQTLGFLYVINHGYTSSQTERIFDIADVLFSCVDSDEKRLYAANTKVTGSHQGYKPRQSWHINNGVQDQLEHYAIHRNVTMRQHPEAIRPFLNEIEAFARHTHFNLRLLALGLELPEETLVNLHGFSSVGETQGKISFLRQVVLPYLLDKARFIKYYPRSEDDELKTKNVWLKGHTDIGSITVLYSQPIAALQMLGQGGKWKWVKHIENAVIINAGDVMEFLSGGYYKATIHRVVQPPVDQRNHTRLGVFYFALPDDNVQLVPFIESPVLQRVGIVRRYEDADAPTTEAWRKSRTSAYGYTQLKAADNGSGVEEETINGVLVKHYN
ncbi:hypothetical protein MSAN_00948300 [Mycena sanguinolenta]|uniref:Fe2OG dioxygenase domain-containing protein n=1 Tax=Mycena sanguinolenta TaxID=230812 RepID=A0A8H7DCU0_9AGAR|nr:hypothetical protein MSAN_00948300 [Mycena sanguinolenta]